MGRVGAGRGSHVLFYLAKIMSALRLAPAARKKDPVISQRHS